LDANLGSWVAEEHWAEQWAKLNQQVAHYGSYPQKYAHFSDLPLQFEQITTGAELLSNIIDGPEFGDDDQRESACFVKRFAPVEECCLPLNDFKEAIFTRKGEVLAQSEHYWLYNKSVSDGFLRMYRWTNFHTGIGHSNAAFRLQNRARTEHAGEVFVNMLYCIAYGTLDQWAGYLFTILQKACRSEYAFIEKSNRAYTGNGVRYVEVSYQTQVSSNTRNLAELKVLVPCCAGAIITLVEGKWVLGCSRTLNEKEIKPILQHFVGSLGRLTPFAAKLLEHAN
jgi:hypothetical protein